MPDEEAHLLREALERLQSGELRSDDVALVLQALRDGRVVRAAGARSVAIDGDVIQSIIITGDNVQFNLPVEALEKLGISIRQIESRLKVIENLVGGLRKLQTTYAASVRSFLEYYLGKPELPAPFGGREADLQALDNWLADPAAPSYACLVAPAGRGKSALLAHWVQRLEMQAAGEWRIVLFPISVRYSTNLESTVFAALSSSLAYLHGENIPQAFSADQYKGLFQDYLHRPLPDGQRLLVVLDGLDEAAGWQVGAGLFPTTAPPHLRVVVAARPLANDRDEGAWLNRLDWEGPGKAQLFGLERLTSDGLRDVLQAMGNPLDRLATNIDVVSHLHALSDGDPLLVRLYVEALLGENDQATTLIPEDLLELKPGLQAYFEKWFTEQGKLWGERRPLRERTVRGLLNLCVAARGPLGRDDLLKLAPEIFEDSFLIEDAAGQVNRFVIGDGLRSGYVFSHPRLGEYFADKLTPVERQGWEQRFLAYGRETVTALHDGRLVAKKASAYIVRYYGAHLVDTDAPLDDFYPLLHKAWREAWEWVDGTPSGFLSDARRAWDAAERAGEGGLGGQTRSLLCIASVVSQSANIPIELLEQCVKAGVISVSFGLVLARQKVDSQEKAICLARLSHLVVDPTEQVDVLQEALTVAQEIKREYTRAEALSGLAPYLLPKLLPQTLVVAQTIENKHARTRVLFGLAGHFPELLPQALTAAQAIENEHARARAFSELAPHLPPELFPQALTVAQKIKDGDARAKALTGLAPHFPELLPHALDAAQAIEDKKARTEVLSELTMHFPELLPQALAAAKAIKDKDAFARVLSGLASHFPELLSQALAAAQGTEEGTRAWVLSRLASHFPELLPQALDAAQAIEDENTLARVLSELVPHLPYELLPRTLVAAQAIEWEETRANVLSRLAQHFLELLPQALDAAQAIENKDVRARTLSRLAAHFPELLPQALDAAQAIKREYTRNEMLSGLAPHLPPELLPQALAATQAIKDEDTRAEVFSGLASHSPELLPQALATAQAIEHEYTRARVLSGLAPHLPPNLFSQVLDAALAIEWEGTRAWALSELAPCLPPELLPQALTAAQAIEDKDARAGALSGLAAHFPELLPEALDAAQAIVDEYARAEALSRLAPCLPSELLPQALAAARAIEAEGTRAEALSGLAVHFPELLPQALAVAQAIEAEGTRAEALSGLAPLLSTELLSQALTAAQAIEWEGTRASVLSRLAPHLPSELVPQVLDTVKVIRDSNARAWALSGLAPHLPPELLPQVLAATQKIEKEDARTWALSGMVKYLPAALLSDIFFYALDTPTVAPEILASLSERWGETCRAVNLSELDSLTKTLRVLSYQRRLVVLDGLKSLVPVIVRLGGITAAEETARAILDVGEWWP